MTAKELGWNVNEDIPAVKNEYGNWEFQIGDTLWEYDEDERLVRNCGTEPGCFWTDWREL